MFTTTQTLDLDLLLSYLNTAIASMSVYASAALSVYIGALAVVGFLLTCRGLPWWYQLLMGAAASLAVAGLWLTCLTDPGIIPASTDPGNLLHMPLRF